MYLLNDFPLRYTAFRFDIVVSCIFFVYECLDVCCIVSVVCMFGIQISNEAVASTPRVMFYMTCIPHVYPFHIHHKIQSYLRQIHSLKYCLILM